MRKYIGTRSFYRMVFRLLLPIVVQNTISNFVSLLDNLMVGSVGTEQMSGVAIANQLLMIFTLCLFGGFSGIGIFTSQFSGIEDWDGVRKTFRVKAAMGAILLALALGIFLLFPRPLISLYLSDGEGAGDLTATLGYSLSYLRIMLLGLPALTLSTMYASTLRECGKTVLPMKAGIIAVLVNLAGNWILIYGNLGFRPMGVAGAAIATVLSRYVELGVVAITAHRDGVEFPFISGIWRPFTIDMALLRRMLPKSFPLLANEFFWSLGEASLLAAYSQRGLAAVAALNISSTVSNMFYVICMSMGSAVGIIVGQSLGKGDLDKARELARQCIAFGIFCGVVCGTIMFFVAPLIPSIYNTTDTVRHLAGNLLKVSSVQMFVFSFLHTCYFTIRSGGKTLVTFCFDCGFSWLCLIPLAYILAHFTSLPILQLYICVQCASLLKCAIGYVLLKKGNWARDLTKVA